MTKKKLKEETKERKKIEPRIKVNRVPRPIGLTMRALAYQMEPDPTKKTRIKDEMIQWTIDQYSTQGMQLNGKVINVEELANYLNLPIEITIKRLNRTLERVGNILKGADGAQFARGLLVQAIKKSLEIQAQTQSQANMLLAQQEGQYVPFLSSSANQALKNLMDSQKPIMDLLKIFADNAKMSVNTDVELPSGNTYFDTDQAVNMINQNTKSILMDGHLLEAKASSLDMPEVQANKQDLTSIGIKNMVPKETTYLAPEAREEVPKTRKGHEDRREASMGIDEVLDAEDFVA